MLETVCYICQSDSNDKLHAILQYHILQITYTELLTVDTFK